MLSGHKESTQKLSVVNDTESADAVSTDNILSSFRRMDEKNREALRNHMQQIENELLIEAYDRKNQDERREFFAKMDDYKKNIVINHYLKEFDSAVDTLEARNHDAVDTARAMAKQLKDIHKSAFQQNAGTKFNDDDFLNILHTTTNFITTPDHNQQMAPNPAFARRSDELSEASAQLRKSGRWKVVAGLAHTLMTLMWIGANVYLGLHVAGIIGAASALSNVIHAIAPIGIAVNAYLTLKHGYAAVGNYANAHRYFSLTNKMNALNKKMQPADPQEEAPAPNANTIKLT